MLPQQMGDESMIIIILILVSCCFVSNYFEKTEFKAKFIVEF